MGRFGNVMLAAGETDLALDAKRGEVVRFYFTNTANTRVFKVGVRRRAHEAGRRRQRPLRARAVRRLGHAGALRARRSSTCCSTAPARSRSSTARRTTIYPLGTITVAGEVEDPAPGLAFDTLRENAEFAELREQIAPRRAAEPDKSLAFVAEMDFEEPEGPVIYTCPMHPEVVSETPGSCPECGMKLMPRRRRRATSARCTRRSSRRSRASARSAA